MRKCVHVSGQDAFTELIMKGPYSVERILHLFEIFNFEKIYL